VIDFNVFWNEYPRKVGRKIAERKWKTLDEDERRRVLHGLALWKCSSQWVGGGGEYIPYASTFLNQERWRDEPWNGAFEQYPFREGTREASLFEVRRRA
jgi:hypothetical protein